MKTIQFLQDSLTYKIKYFKMLAYDDNFKAVFFINKYK